MQIKASEQYQLKKRHNLAHMNTIKAGNSFCNGINIHYLEAGQGPLVICLHGFPDHADSFRTLLTDLADSGFRAVAPYLRGYAPTDIPDNGRFYTVDMATDLLALIDALGYNEAFLVGNDWGAQASIGASILKPTVVKKLIIIGASIASEELKNNYSYLKGIWHLFFFQSAAAEKVIKHNDFAFIEAWWRDAAPCWDIPKTVMNKVKETFRKPGVAAASLEHYRARERYDQLDVESKKLQDLILKGPVDVPTLAIHGDSDRPMRLRAFESDKMKSFFKNDFERMVIDKTGHFPHQEKPETVNPIIIEYLTK